jgi:hypothetical protein
LNCISYKLILVSTRNFGAYCTTGERRGAYRVLVENPGGKRPLGGPRIRREDRIETDFQEVGDMDWIDLAQDKDMWRVVLNAVKGARFP